MTFFFMFLWQVYYFSSQEIIFNLGNYLQLIQCRKVFTDAPYFVYLLLFTIFKENWCMKTVVGFLVCNCLCYQSHFSREWDIMSNFDYWRVVPFTVHYYGVVILWKFLAFMNLLGPRLFFVCCVKIDYESFLFYYKSFFATLSMSIISCIIFFFIECMIYVILIFFMSFIMSFKGFHTVSLNIVLMNEFVQD